MLIEKYREIFATPDKWRYYDELYFFDNPFDSDDVRDSFIYTYFQTGRKETVLDSKIPKDKLRDIHSISTFFLGILLRDVCKVPEIKPDFRYLWFITCLYHDYGYFFENKKNKYPPQKTSLSKLLSDLKIKYCLLRTKYNSFYSIDTIKIYYNYCRNECNFINHGIIGGLLLYDKLMKNFESNKREALSRNSNLDVKDFEHKGLHWSSSHKDFYKLAADSIISHNIWLATNDDNKKKYEGNGLNSLIINNKNSRISCESNPFLFLLLLADTIEPIKFFTQYKCKCILEKIDISINAENEIIISVLDNCLQFQDWFRKIKDLENWTKVSVIQVDKILRIKIE